MLITIVWLTTEDPENMTVLNTIFQRCTQTRPRCQTGFSKSASAQLTYQSFPAWNSLTWQ